MRSNILIVEDEVHLAEGLKLNLSLHGHNVETVDNGLKALECWQDYDLIVLDIMLPGMDGLKVLEKIRQIDSQMPVLVLSAKGETEDKVNAFKQGVDDYLAKPFELEELLVRVDRLLEKTKWFQKKREDISKFSFGDNTVDFENATANCSGNSIQLTEQEMKVLKLFFERPNKSLSREELLNLGWGYDENTSTRTVDNFIVRFRKYFEKDPKKPIYFKSIRSIGYIFSPEGK